MKKIFNYIASLLKKTFNLFKRKKEMDANNVASYLQRYLGWFFNDSKGSAFYKNFITFKSKKVIIPKTSIYSFPNLIVETRNIKNGAYEVIDWSSIDVNHIEKIYNMEDTQTTISIDALYLYLNSQLCEITSNIFLPLNNNYSLFNPNTFKEASEIIKQLLITQGFQSEYNSIENIINHSIDCFLSNNEDSINGIPVGKLLQNKNFASLKLGQ